jgi:hypothetical protein
VNTSASAKRMPCILPKGKALALQRALLAEQQLVAGIVAGNFHFGRAVRRDSHIRERGIGEQQEREIFDLIVPVHKADDLFEFIFFEAGMNEPRSGMIFMTDVKMSTDFSLPDVTWEAEQTQARSKLILFFLFSSYFSQWGFSESDFLKEALSKGAFSVWIFLSRRRSSPRAIPRLTA